MGGPHQLEAGGEALPGEATAAPSGRGFCPEWDNAKRMFDTATRQAPPLLCGPVHRAMSPTIGSRHLRWAR
jgi:hypothetical protein